MLNLIKDILKPTNWLKLILNPKKINIITKRVLYYPGLKFGYSKLKIYRNFEIYLTTYLAKKNQSLKKIFFKESNNIGNRYRFSFDRSNLVNEEQIKCISDNGILILENVLNYHDYAKIRELVFKSSTSTENKEINSDQNQFVKKSLTSFFLEDDDLLCKISKKITQKIYGAPVKPLVNILTSIPNKLPEPDIIGDNIFHPDRYLPNIKMFFYPDDVNLGEGHFDYALGSHKINKAYLRFFKENKDCIFDERNEDSNNFLKFKKEITVKKNSLVVACTNGFHRRSKFQVFKTRKVITFLYPNFNIGSLINFKKFNNFLDKNQLSKN